MKLITKTKLYIYYNLLALLSDKTPENSEFFLKNISKLYYSIVDSFLFLYHYILIWPISKAITYFYLLLASRPNYSSFFYAISQCLAVYSYSTFDLQLLFTKVDFINISALLLLYVIK